ncbi:MAG TPA: PH domain-containing protein [Verrucomicrobiae bacterium]
MSEETTVFRGSPSMVTRFGGLFLAFLVFVGALTGFILLRNNAELVWVKYLLGALAVAALIHLMVIVLFVKATRYEVTSERIRITRGIFTKRTDELELYRANDTSLIEPMTLRMFGLGTIEVRTMDTSNPVVFLEAVHGARKLREDLRKHIELCRDRKGVRVTEFDNPTPGAASGTPNT